MNFGQCWEVWRGFGRKQKAFRKSSFGKVSIGDAVGAMEASGSIIFAVGLDERVLMMVERDESENEFWFLRSRHAAVTT